MNATFEEQKRAEWGRIAQAFASDYVGPRSRRKWSAARFGLCWAIGVTPGGNSLRAAMRADLAEVQPARPAYGMYWWPLDRGGDECRVVMATLLALGAADDV